MSAEIRTISRVARGRFTQLLTRSFPAGEFRDCVACRFPRTYAEPGRLERSEPGQSSPNFALSTITSAEMVLQPNPESGWRKPLAGSRLRSYSSHQVASFLPKILTLNEANEPSLHNGWNACANLSDANWGEGITHAFVDIGLYPGQHISGDWVEQWGPDNRQLSGLSVSLFDPVLGIGAAHYWVLPFGESLVGAKLLMSFPTATAEFATSIADEDEDPPELIDPLLNLVAVYRMPIRSVELRPHSHRLYQCVE